MGASTNPAAVTVPVANSTRESVVSKWEGGRRERERERIDRRVKHNSGPMSCPLKVGSDDKGGEKGKKQDWFVSADTCTHTRTQYNTVALMLTIASAVMEWIAVSPSYLSREEWCSSAGVLLGLCLQRLWRKLPEINTWNVRNILPHQHTHIHC